MIDIYSDIEALSHAAAELFVLHSQEAVRERGRFCVALAGGETPRLTYELLARPPYRNQVPWEQVDFFWGDERCVPPGDPRSNERMAREALLDHVPVSPGQIHPVCCFADPTKAGDAYEVVIQRYFGGGPARFDLMFLSLGEDGHTASLFPGMPILEQRERWVGQVCPAGEHIFRVTLTAPLINQSRLIAFLVAGREKAQVLRNVLEGPYMPFRLPAQLVQPLDGQLRWLVDEQAAALLSHSYKAG